jgi:hypothetical protein
MAVMQKQLQTHRRLCGFCSAQTSLHSKAAPAHQLAALDAQHNGPWVLRAVGTPDQPQGCTITQYQTQPRQPSTL